MRVSNVNLPRTGTVEFRHMPKTIVRDSITDQNRKRISKEKVRGIRLNALPVAIDGLGTRNRIMTKRTDELIISKCIRNTNVIQ